MQDRMPVYPGRIKLTPVSGLSNVYDMERADSPTQEGTALNKANLLADETEALIFGSAQNKTPNEALAALAARATRPNLLDNWCFLPGYVVNQRGATDITEGGYGIDRWASYTGRTAPCSVESDGIHISCANSQTGGFQQRLLASKLIPGKQYTVSALVKVVSDTRTGTYRNVILSYGNAFDSINTSTSLKAADAPIGEWICFSATFTALETDVVTSNVRIRLQKSNDTEIIIAAMKLELGDTQTLAHQDADGNWVLNEYPDYNEQLLRCCMSTADSSDTYANNKMTPAAINAVNKAGDEMTGALKLASKANSYVTLTNDDYAGQTYLGGAANVTSVINRNVANNTSNFRGFQIFNSAGMASIASAIRVQDQVSSSSTYYSVLTKANVVTGTYTGTGVVGTAATIAVGFEPSAVFVLRSDSSASISYGTAKVGFGMCIKSGDSQGRLTTAKASSAANAYTTFNGYIEITSTGFSVLKYHSSYENSPNEADVVYTYLAIL